MRNYFSKLVGAIFIGIIILSEVQFSPGIIVKTVCIDGLEFVVAYPLKWSMGNILHAKAPTSVIQVYDKSDYAHGSPQPKSCK